MEKEKTNLKWFEIEQQKQRQEIEAGFDLKKELFAYLDKKYPVDSGHFKELSDKYKKAIEEENINELEDLAEVINNWITYIAEKLRGSEEDGKSLLRLEILHEKLLAWIDELLEK
ncbi:MAG: hypothetical protein PHT40_04085 [Patescibacteria group bacterium]|nr:hypothetical protein [Patescibacteria group bacterium]